MGLMALPCGQLCFALPRVALERDASHNCCEQQLAWGRWRMANVTLSSLPGGHWLFLPLGDDPCWRTFNWIVCSSLDSNFEDEPVSHRFQDQDFVQTPRGVSCLELWAAPSFSSNVVQFKSDKFYWHYTDIQHDQGLFNLITWNVPF